MSICSDILYEDLSLHDDSNDEIDNLIEEILHISLTPQSIEFRGPCGLPLGIEVAVNAFKREKFSTAFILQDYLPPPLKQRSVPIAQGEEKIPSTELFELGIPTGSLRDPQSPRYHLDFTKSRDSIVKSLYAELSGSESTAPSLIDSQSPRNSLNSVDESRYSDYHLLRGSDRPEQLLAFLYRDELQSRPSPAIGDLPLQASGYNTSLVPSTLLDVEGPLSRISRRSPKERLQDSSNYKAKPLPPIPSPKEAITVPSNYSKSQSTAALVSSPGTSQVLRRRRLGSGPLLELKDNGQRPDPQVFQTSDSSITDLPAPLSPSSVSRSRNQEVALRSSARETVSPIEPVSKLPLLYLSHPSHRPSTHSAASSDPTHYALPKRNSSLSQSSQPYASVDLKGSKASSSGIDTGSKLSLSLEGLLEYHKAHEDLQGLYRIKPRENLTRKMRVKKSHTLDDIPDEPSDFSLSESEQEPVLQSSKYYPMKTKRSLLRRISQYDHEENEGYQKPSPNHDSHHIRQDVHEKFTLAHQNSLLPEEKSPEVKALKEQPPEAVIHPGRLVTGSTTATSSVYSADSDATETPQLERERHEGEPGERRHQMPMRKFDCMTVGASLRRRKKRFDKVGSFLIPKENE